MDRRLALSSEALRRASGCGCGALTGHRCRWLSPWPHPWGSFKLDTNARAPPLEHLTRLVGSLLFIFLKAPQITPVRQRGNSAGATGPFPWGVLTTDKEDMIFLRADQIPQKRISISRLGSGCLAANILGPSWEKGVRVSPGLQVLTLSLCAHVQTQSKSMAQWFWSCSVQHHLDTWSKCRPPGPGLVCCIRNSRWRPGGVLWSSVGEQGGQSLCCSEQGEGPEHPGASCADAWPVTQFLASPASPLLEAPGPPIPYLRVRHGKQWFGVFLQGPVSFLWSPNSLSPSIYSFPAVRCSCSLLLCHSLYPGSACPGPSTDILSEFARGHLIHPVLPNSQDTD